MTATDEHPYDDLGGRWSELADRPPPPDPADTQEVEAADEAVAWTPGYGHRVLRVAGVWCCVVCGEKLMEWPTTTCDGPSGVAL